MITPERREYVRAFQREWLQKRRMAWIKANGPCKHCGCWLELEVDHIDPADKKAHTREVWSWRKDRREAELAKCQVLCKPCHVKKTFADMGWAEHNPNRYRRGCRCKICVASVKLVYKRAYQQQLKREGKACGQGDEVRIRGAVNSEGLGRYQGPQPATKEPV